MMIDPSGPPDKPETAQMVVIHKAFRREFGLLPSEVGAVPAGDTQRAARIASHAEMMIGTLHEHHDSEDQLLWPLLHERVPQRDPLIDTMTTQHAAVADHLTVVVSRMRSWADTADATSRDLLVADLTHLRDILDEHLDLEEREVLPLIHEHLTVPEWKAPQRQAEASLPGGFRRRMLLAGVVLEDSTPRERTWFLSQLPAPARLLWRLLGARLYAAHIRSIRLPAGRAVASMSGEPR